MRTMMDTVHNILINAAYLLGEWIAWICEKFPITREALVSFIEGFIDAPQLNLQ